jgi:hypothetical protein
MVSRFGVAVVVALSLPLSPHAQAATVHVEGGEVVGTTSSDGAIARYLGLPYAAAPVGGLGPTRARD